MKLGVIGGSGLYGIDALEGAGERRVETPFGAPSDAILTGTLYETEVYFLPRHGRGHRLLPSEINHRANLFALKSLGVCRVVSFTAAGSLREDVRPRDILLPDQYVDRTRQGHTFFGNGLVGHVPFGDPVCPDLHARLARLAEPLLDGGRRLHRSGTYVNMEGPAFSTRAESETYRRLGYDLIGMTSLHEARLAREARMCYAPVALITDYDCWHATEAVQADLVVENVRANVRFARELICALARDTYGERTCPCPAALLGAILTDEDAIPPPARRILEVLAS